MQFKIAGNKKPVSTLNSSGNDSNSYFLFITIKRLLIEIEQNLFLPPETVIIKDNRLRV